jgi:DNA repair protein RadD
MLRDYQQKLMNDVFASWNAGNRNVLAISPTGSGKTRTMQSIVDLFKGFTMSIAHRRELVGQISLALAMAGVYHRIIAPDPIIKLIVMIHMRKLGRSFVHPNANHMVASVNTIVSRIEQLRDLILQCQLWNMDEGHHIRADNLWGRAVKEFKNAWGAGYTALGQRGDGKALGRVGGGVFDSIVIGPGIRELIDRGFLCDYIVYAPQLSSIDVSDVPITASGDYSQPKLSDAAKRSTITGDIVRDYLRFAPGKRGITFCVDVGNAEEVTAAFIQAGVPVALVTDNTGDKARDDAVSDLGTGLIKQFVNVNIAGEGLDIPAVEVVSLGRPTASEQMHRQQIGRVLRPCPEIGKTHGIINDHVKNIETLRCPPDKPGNHSLDAISRATRSTRDPDEIPIHTCPACWRMWEGWSQGCPHCGHTPAPVLRDRPELVEGNLLLYTPDLLLGLMSDIERVAEPPKLPVYAGTAAVIGRRNSWADQQDALAELKDGMSWWAGVQLHVYGRSDTEMRVRFYRLFGMDSLKAQALGATQARALNNKIWEDIGNDVDRHHLK